LLISHSILVFIIDQSYMFVV